jgi:hypothetical protein
MGTIGTKPLAQFADWKLASDETGLKAEGVSSAEETDKERRISLSVVPG